MAPKPVSEHTMLSNAETDAVLSVLWHTHAIRSCYEDVALRADERMWKNNGGMFPNFSRYNSQKWKDMMGPDDPTVRGRRISQASMAQARRDFENSYREPIYFAIELIDRIRTEVAKAIEKKGAPAGGEYSEEVGWQVWDKIGSDVSVRAKLAKLAGYPHGDIAHVQP